jgi:hypothetical protein
MGQQMNLAREEIEKCNGKRNVCERKKRMIQNVNGEAAHENAQRHRQLSCHGMTG